MSTQMKIDGKTIHTPTAPVVIEVTDKHIANGSRRGPTVCAAAIACKNQIDNCTQARVHVTTTYLLRSGKWYRYSTPNALRYELIAFDRGGKMKPGTYILRPKAIRNGGKVKPRGKGGQKNFKPHKLEGVRPRISIGAQDV